GTLFRRIPSNTPGVPNFRLLRVRSPLPDQPLGPGGNGKSAQRGKNTQTAATCPIPDTAVHPFLLVPTKRPCRGLSYSAGVATHPPEYARGKALRRRHPA